MKTSKKRIYLDDYKSLHDNWVFPEASSPKRKVLNHRLVLGALNISSALVDAPKKGPLASSDHARPQLGAVSNSMGDEACDACTVSTHNISF